MSVRVCENGIYRDATEAEIARMEAEKPDPLPEESTDVTRRGGNPGIDYGN